MAGKIEFIVMDITRMHVDAIVNAANSNLAQGGGVCGAIFRAAGSEKLNKACASIGHCDTGNAVITPGFNLYAKYIIHAVGPIWKDGKHDEEKLLYSCYQKSLDLALKHDCHSIAFPLISSGIYGYPKKDAWHTALQACSDFLQKHESYDLTVYFCVLDLKSEQEGIEELCRIQKGSKKFILFHKENEKPYGCFSNWYRCDFEVEGIRYSSTEQYMMAKKALLCNDLETYEQIMHTTSPAVCKRLGRKVKNFDDRKWNEARWSIVHHAIKAKFSQNEDLQKILLQTNGQIIAEAAPRDLIWGIGMGASEDGADNPENWKGQNFLGQILMQVRKELGQQIES